MLSPWYAFSTFEKFRSNCVEVSSIVYRYSMKGGAYEILFLRSNDY